ncbi:MAG: hypothetical protein ACR2RD_07020, partial [Woeseiaceae bacterium]
AAIYGAPEARTTEVNEDGFVGVYFIGFGYNKRTGFGSQVRFAMQVRKIIGQPFEVTDIDALIIAVEERSDYLTDQAGMESVTRFEDFESIRLRERNWVSLASPTATSVYTHFNDEHFLSLNMMFDSKYKPSPNERMALDKVLLDITSRIDIRPASVN